MRQDHRAGEKLFVDYAGHTVAVIDPETGEARAAQIFVAVMGASNYTYAEATWTQRLVDWIGAHVRAMTFLGAVPEIVVPDNLKSAVSSGTPLRAAAEPHLPGMGRALQSGNPARAPGAPSGQGQGRTRRVAGGALDPGAIARPPVLLAGRTQRRDRTLAQASQRPAAQEAAGQPPLTVRVAGPSGDAAIAGQAVRVCRVEDGAGACRLPRRESTATTTPCRISWSGKQLDARFTANTVEVFHKRQRVASHRRAYRRGRHTTVAQHMPSSHRAHAEWTPQRLVRWAEKSGPATAELVHHVLASRAHPQHGFRSCLGIMRLGQRYGDARLEAACRRALALGTNAYKSIDAILKNGLDKKPLPTPTPEAPVIEHLEPERARITSTDQGGPTDDVSPNP